MAKIKFGMMMTDASGKLGGHVFAKNRGGSYVRTKGIPSNPQNSFQMAVRGRFAAISSRWSALTEAQRLTFNGFVQAYATTDVFGDLRNPSGKALFQRLNQNLANTAQTELSACVAPTAVPFASITGVSGDITGSDLRIVTSGDLTGSKVLVLGTPMLSQGTRFIKNDLRVIDVVDGGNGASIACWDSYSARFGTPVAGANIVLGCRVVNSNGQASPLETLKAVIIP